MHFIRATYKIVTATLAVMVLACCSGSKPAVKEGPSTFKRAPIVERNEESVRTDAMLIDAKMKQENGDKVAATQLYRQIITRDPQYASAYYQLSHIMAEDRKIDSAIMFAEKAVALNDTNVWYKLHAALLYRYANRIDDQIRVWEQIVRQKPEVLQYYFELSNVYLMAGNTKKAIATLDRVEKRVGISEAVSMQKAKLWNAEGETKKAMHEIELLAETMPNENKYNAILAENYMQGGQYSKAKVYYDRILANNPDDEYIHISLAEYYKRIKKPREAYEELRKGFMQNNLSTDNKIQILSTFYSPEEFFGTYSTYAFDLLDVVMQRSSNNTAYAAFYGDVLMRQQKYDEASRQFEIALSADSSRYEVWDALLVSMLQDTNKADRMDNYAARASKLFPLHPLPYLVRAIVAHDRGNYADAIPYALRCEQMGFDNGRLEPETYSILAECYNRSGDKRCREYYKKYLALRPDDIVMLNSYAYHLAVSGEELEEAERMSRRTLKAEPDNPNYLDTYSWVLYRMGRIDDAKPFIEKAFKIFIKGGVVSTEVMEHYNTILQKQ